MRVAVRLWRPTSPTTRPVLLLAPPFGTVVSERNREMGLGIGGRGRPTRKRLLPVSFRRQGNMAKGDPYGDTRPTAALVLPTTILSQILPSEREKGEKRRDDDNSSNCWRNRTRHPSTSSLFSIRPRPICTAIIYLLQYYYTSSSGGGRTPTPHLSFNFLFLFPITHFWEGG